VAKTDNAVQEMFSQLYEAHQKEIYSFCLSRLHCNVELAEDCVQDTFIVLYKRMKAGEDIHNPRAFLYKTAYNITMKCWQKNKKRQEKELLKEETVDEVPDEQFVISEQLDFEQLQEALLLLLNKKEQQLYELYFQRELSIKEIAAILGITPHNCTVRLSRLRSKIKSGLQKYMEGDFSDGNSE